MGFCPSHDRIGGCKTRRSLNHPSIIRSALGSRRTEGYFTKYGLVDGGEAPWQAQLINPGAFESIICSILSAYFVGGGLHETRTGGRLSCKNQNDGPTMVPATASIRATLLETETRASMVPSKAPAACDGEGDGDRVPWVMQRLGHSEASRSWKPRGLFGEKMTSFSCSLRDNIELRQSGPLCVHDVRSPAEGAIEGSVLTPASMISREMARVQSCDGKVALDLCFRFPSKTG